MPDALEGRAPGRGEGAPAGGCSGPARQRAADRTPDGEGGPADALLRDAEIRGEPAPPTTSEHGRGTSPLAPARSRRVIRQCPSSRARWSLDHRLFLLGRGLGLWLRRHDAATLCDDTAGECLPPGA